jgi:transposase
MRNDQKRRVAQIVSLYQAGHTLSSIAKRVGRSISTVCFHLHRAGITLRPVGMPPKRPTSDEAAKLYHAGWSLPQLAKKFTISTETARKRLEVAGIKARGRGRQPKDFRLPVKELRLYLEQGKNVREIAQNLGISHETVRKRLVLVKRGLEALGKSDEK